MSECCTPHHLPSTSPKWKLKVIISTTLNDQQGSSCPLSKESSASLYKATQGTSVWEETCGTVNRRPRCCAIHQLVELGELCNLWVSGCLLAKCGSLQLAHSVVVRDSKEGVYKIPSPGPRRWQVSEKHSFLSPSYLSTQHPSSFPTCDLALSNLPAHPCRDPCPPYTLLQAAHAPSNAPFTDQALSFT